MFDIEKIRELLKTESNTAYFWSGLGVDGATIAADVARNNGGVTLEIIMENNKQAFIDAGFPYNPATGEFFWSTDEAVAKAWSDVSEAYANHTSGNVRAVLGDSVTDGSVWRRSELPSLLNNSDVNSINGIPTKQLNNLYNSLGRDSECLRFIHCIYYTSAARGFIRVLFKIPLNTFIIVRFRLWHLLMKS